MSVLVWCVYFEFGQVANTNYFTDEELIYVLDPVNRGRVFLCCKMKIDQLGDSIFKSTD